MDAQFEGFLNTFGEAERAGGRVLRELTHGIASNKTGDFVEKVRAVGDFRGKLDLLNRGQRWVIRKIEESLPTITDPELRAFLSVMAKGHHVIIGPSKRR
jgi:Domain of unknown function (DUF6306)